MGVIFFLGPARGGHCLPCGRHSWGAEISLRCYEDAQFLCVTCLHLMARQLQTRIQEILDKYHADAIPLLPANPDESHDRR